MVAKVKAKVKVGGRVRANRVLEWVRDRYGKKRVTQLTADELAAVATRELEAKVNANTMCRALRKLKITYKTSPLDPIPRHYSKVDLLKVRVDYLERRLTKLEKAGK